MKYKGLDLSKIITLLEKGRMKEEHFWFIRVVKLNKFYLTNEKAGLGTYVIVCSFLVI